MQSAGLAVLALVVVVAVAATHNTHNPHNDGGQDIFRSEILRDLSRADIIPQDRDNPGYYTRKLGVVNYSSGDRGSEVGDRGSGKKKMHIFCVFYTNWY